MVAPGGTSEVIPSGVESAAPERSKSPATLASLSGRPWLVHFAILPTQPYFLKLEHGAKSKNGITRDSSFAAGVHGFLVVGLLVFLRRRHACGHGHLK